MKITLKRALVVIATVWVFLCLLLIQLLFGERLFPRAQVVVSADRDVCGGERQSSVLVPVSLIISLYDYHNWLLTGSLCCVFMPHLAHLANGGVRQLWVFIFETCSVCENYLYSLGHKPQPVLHSPILLYHDAWHYKPIASFGGCSSWDSKTLISQAVEDSGHCSVSSGTCFRSCPCLGQPCICQ